MKHANSPQKRWILLLLLTAFAFSGPLRAGTIEDQDAAVLKKPYRPPQTVSAAELNYLVFVPETKKLIEEKKYDEALGRFVWWFDHIHEYDAAFSGVKGSFFLADWMKFARVYPEAEKVLRAMRDHRVELFKSGKAQLTYPVYNADGSLRNWSKNPPAETEWDLFFRSCSGDTVYFSDITGIDRVLGDRKTAYELFLYLDQNNPPMAKEVWTQMREKVIAAGNMELAQKYIPDFKAEWKSVTDGLAQIDAAIKAKEYKLAVEARLWGLVTRAKSAILVFRSKQDAPSQAFADRCQAELDAFLAQEQVKPYRSVGGKIF